MAKVVMTQEDFNTIVEGVESLLLTGEFQLPDRDTSEAVAFFKGLRTLGAINAVDTNHWAVNKEATR